MMADPVYLGVNELGLPVWEIEEGGMRPMVDKDGKIECKSEGGRFKPRRVHLGWRNEGGTEWVLLACPACDEAHCMMRVKLMGRMMAGAPSLTEIDKPHPDPHHEIEVAPCIVPGMEEEMTGGKLHYTDPKKKVRAGLEAAVAHGKKHGNG